MFILYYLDINFNYRLRNKIITFQHIIIYIYMCVFALTNFVYEANIF